MKVDVTLALEALAEAKKSHSGWYRANCPYCELETGKADRRASLGLKPSISFFACFKCGARGRLPNDETVTLLAALDRHHEDEAPPETFEPPPGYEALDDDDAWTSVLLREPREYLIKRGISRETIIDAKIGACVFGKLAGRVVVPCLDLDGRTWIGYSARDWTNTQDPRYKYPPGMQRAKFLYNQAALYRPSTEPVLIVEGVFDALPYWPDVVACNGKPGDVHKQLLGDAGITRPIAICLDGDAHEEAWALSERLRLDGRLTGYVQLPPCTDPNSVDREWLKKEARSCIRY